jgi:hypothetical protein
LIASLKRKVSRLALFWILLGTLVTSAFPLAEASVGWERVYSNGNNGEVYVEYPPDVYYDKYNLDADTKFPVKYYVRLKDYLVWDWWILGWWHWVPDYFRLTVYAYDASDGYNEANMFDMMRFYPVQSQQDGLQLSYSFSAGVEGGYASGSIGITVDFPLTSFDWNYQHSKVSGYDTLGWLVLDYQQNGFWGSAYSEGSFEIAVHNRQASYNKYDRIYFKLVFEVAWQRGVDWDWINPTYRETSTFIIGDDIPGNDVYLDVVPGTVGG